MRSYLALRLGNMTEEFFRCETVFFVQGKGNIPLLRDLCLVGLIRPSPECKSI